MTDKSIHHLFNTKYSQARSGVNLLKKAVDRNDPNPGYISNINQHQLSSLLTNDFKPQHETIDTGFGNALDTINAHVRLASAHLDACNSLASKIWGATDEDSNNDAPDEQENSNNNDEYLTIHFAYALRNLAEMLQTKHSKALMHFLRQGHPNSADHIQETIDLWLDKPLNQQNRPTPTQLMLLAQTMGHMAQYLTHHKKHNPLPLIAKIEAIWKQAKHLTQSQKNDSTEENLHGRKQPVDDSKKTSQTDMHTLITIDASCNIKPLTAETLSQKIITASAITASTPIISILAITVSTILAVYLPTLIPIVGVIIAVTIPILGAFAINELITSWRKRKNIQLNRIETERIEQEKLSAISKASPKDQINLIKRLISRLSMGSSATNNSPHFIGKALMAITNQKKNEADYSQIIIEASVDILCNQHEIASGINDNFTKRLEGMHAQWQYSLNSSGTASPANKVLWQKAMAALILSITNRDRELQDETQNNTSNTDSTQTNLTDILQKLPSAIKQDFLTPFTHENPETQAKVQEMQKLFASIDPISSSESPSLTANKIQLSMLRQSVEIQEEEENQTDDTLNTVAKTWRDMTSKVLSTASADPFSPEFSTLNTALVSYLNTAGNMAAKTSQTENNDDSNDISKLALPEKGLLSHLLDTINLDNQDKMKTVLEHDAALKILHEENNSNLKISINDILKATAPTASMDLMAMMKTRPQTSRTAWTVKLLTTLSIAHPHTSYQVVMAFLAAGDVNSANLKAVAIALCEHSSLDDNDQTHAFADMLTVLMQRSQAMHVNSNETVDESEKQKPCGNLTEAIQEYHTEKNIADSNTTNSQHGFDLLEHIDPRNTAIETQQDTNQLKTCNQSIFNAWKYHQGADRRIEKTWHVKGRSTEQWKSTMVDIKSATQERKNWPHTARCSLFGKSQRQQILATLPCDKQNENSHTDKNNSNEVIISV